MGDGEGVAISAIVSERVTAEMVPVRGFTKGWCVKFEGIAA
jgi:hypothetical protein